MPDDKEKKSFDFEALARNLESSLGGPSDDPLANGEIKDITNGEVIDQIRVSKTSVVSFYRDECPFCERLVLLLDELAEAYKSKVFFAKVNVDKSANARSEFDVLGVPLVIAFKKGMPVGRVEGLRSTDEYDTWIESIHEGLRPMGMEEGPSTRIP
ncbi:MAG: thioredoxin family protein [Candidatus Thorarchaeota archaeon]|nr:thioredoxin family protein [Candidatus Thorarchaeota archaeon]